MSALVSTAQTPMASLRRRLVRNVELGNRETERVSVWANR